MSRFLLPCLIVGFGMTAAAQDPPLEQFTNDVDVIMKLKEPDRSIEHVADMVNEIQPGLGQMVEQYASSLGMLVANPTMTGVDQTKDWYVGVYSNEQNPPTVVFAIPATEAEEMQDALGDSVVTVVHGGYVFYTENEYEIPTVTAGKTAMDEMTDAARTVFSSGDVSLFVNVDHLTAVYEEQISLGQEQVSVGLDQMRAILAQGSGMNMDAIIDMYGSMAECIFQGLDDARSLTVAVNVGEEGVLIDEHLEFASSSTTSDFLGGMPTSEMANLEKLPAGSAFYYGVSGGVKELTKWGFEISAAMFQSNEDREKLGEILDSMEGLEFGPMVVSMSIGSVEGGLFKVAGIAEASPGDEVREAMRSATKSMQDIEFEGIGFRQEATIEEDAETYGNHTADIVTIKQEYDAAMDPTGMQQKMQQIMFGSDGMQSRMLYLDDKYLTTMGGGQDAMRDLLAQIESSTSNDLGPARKSLLEESNFLVLIDLPSLTGQVLAAVAESEEIPIPIPVDRSTIESLNIVPSYLGFSMGAEPDSLRFRTSIPITQMQGIAKLAMFFVGIAQQQQF